MKIHVLLAAMLLVLISTHAQAEPITDPQDPLFGFDYRVVGIMAPDDEILTEDSRWVIFIEFFSNNFVANLYATAETLPLYQRSCASVSWVSCYDPARTTSVPEPGTVGLLALGASCLWWYRRQRVG